MDAAFGLFAVGPAAGARIVSGIGAARAGHAADGAETLSGKRMPRQVPVLEHRHNFSRRDPCQRIEFQPRTFDLHRRDAGALAALIALATVDPCAETGKRIAERLDLAQIA